MESLLLHFIIYYCTLRVGTFTNLQTYVLNFESSIVVEFSSRLLRKNGIPSKRIYLGRKNVKIR